MPDLLPSTVVGRDTPNYGPMPEGVVCTQLYAANALCALGVRRLLYVTGLLSVTQYASHSVT